MSASCVRVTCANFSFLYQCIQFWIPTGLIHHNIPWYYHCQLPHVCWSYFFNFRIVHPFLSFTLARILSFGKDSTWWNCIISIHTYGDNRKVRNWCTTPQIPIVMKADELEALSLSLTHTQSVFTLFWNDVCVTKHDANRVAGSASQSTLSCTCLFIVCPFLSLFFNSGRNRKSHVRSFGQITPASFSFQSLHIFLPVVLYKYVTSAFVCVPSFVHSMLLLYPNPIVTWIISFHITWLSCSIYFLFYVFAFTRHAQSVAHC